MIGSTQAAGDLDAGALERAGVDLVRRRSGGGAVFVAPGAQLWVDCFVPRGDPLLLDDVSTSFLWLGEAWAGALADVLGRGPDARPPGAPPRTVRAVERAPSPVGRALCFVGRVPGEVVLGEHKVVGCAQRRDRRGAWFHTMALLEFSPEDLTRFLAQGSGGGGKDDPARLLAGAARAVPGGRTVARALEDALVDRLLAL